MNTSFRVVRTNCVPFAGGLFVGLGAPFVLKALLALWVSISAVPLRIPLSATVIDVAKRHQVNPVNSFDPR